MQINNFSINVSHMALNFSLLIAFTVEKKKQLQVFLFNRNNNVYLHYSTIKKIIKLEMSFLTRLPLIIIHLSVVKWNAGPYLEKPTYGIRNICVIFTCQTCVLLHSFYYLLRSTCTSLFSTLFISLRLYLKFFGLIYCM